MIGSNIVSSAIKMGALAATVASGLLAPMPADAAVRHEIWFQNNCRHPVRFFIRHADQYRNWHNHGWWNFRAYQGRTRLTVDHSPLMQRDDHSLYYYAETTNGTGHYWEGTNVQTFNGTSYRLRKAKKSISHGRLTVTLSCTNG